MTEIEIGDEIEPEEDNVESVEIIGESDDGNKLRVKEVTKDLGEITYYQIPELIEIDYPEFKETQEDSESGGSSEYTNAGLKNPW